MILSAPVALILVSKNRSNRNGHWETKNPLVYGSSSFWHHEKSHFQATAETRNKNGTIFRIQVAGHVHVVGPTPLRIPCSLVF